MKYFKYQYQDSYGEIWGLFSGLSNLTKGEILNKNKRWDYSHTSEIINSAMNGNLPKNQEDFDLKAYEIACSKTDDIELKTSRKKYLSIVDTVNGSDTDVVGYGEISSNDKRLKSFDEALEMFEDNEEFEDCLSRLYNLRKDYIVECGVDPVEMLINSLKGIPEAVATITELLLEDSSLKQIVEVLCENGTNLQERLEMAI